MRFLYDNLTVIIVALVASSLTWLFGGARAEWLAPAAPWMLLFLAEAVIAFPQRHENESIHEARIRTWRTLRGDTVVWLALLLIAILAIPFFNVGLCPNCDAGLIAAGKNAAPPYKSLPFCVNVQQHLNVFYWFAIALGCAIAVRDGLCPRGQRAVLALIVWNGLALAVLGFIQVASGAQGPYWTKLYADPKIGLFFATWGYPNMAGDYFTTLFGIAIAQWRWSCDLESTDAQNLGRVKTSHRVFWRKNLYLLPAAVFYVAALTTLSRAAIILVTVLAAVSFFHAFRVYTHGLGRAARVRQGTVVFGLSALLVFFAVQATPDKVQNEVNSLDADTVLTRIAGKNQYHVRVATELWKDHPAFGCGGWGYRHFCAGKMAKSDYHYLRYQGGCNVHNDWLQFLAEHGLVGLLLILAVIGGLLKPTLVGWSRLYRVAMFQRGKARPPRPIAIFALPASALCILLTLTATVVHSFADCPLRAAAILTLFFILMPASAGYLPQSALTGEKEKSAH